MMMRMMMCPQTQPPILQIPTGARNYSMLRNCPQKENVVVVLGATGAGKSRLSIDLAQLYDAEIINSDKMQVYEGLNITTNKITKEECAGVPHHLLGIVDPEADFTAGMFAGKASDTMKSIVGRNKLPIIAGGSNSFIKELIDVQNYEFRSRYNVCFLWVDVEKKALHDFISDRVDRMVDAGIVDELREMYKPNADHSKGIRRAIGVKEFDSYFRKAQHLPSRDRDRLLEDAINETKSNTHTLSCRQRKNIILLRDDRDKGREFHRLDATAVFRKHGREADEAWTKMVARPGLKIVSQFLTKNTHSHSWRFDAASDYDGRTTKRAAEMLATAH